MQPLYGLSSPDALFTSLEESILVCHNFRYGEIEMTVRKVGVDEFELCIFSFKGSFRCHYEDLKSYLGQFPQDTQNQVSLYRDRFKVGLSNILPIGFGSISLDFTKCKKARTAPIFGCTVTQLLERDLQ